jgi:hypothetical protein
MATDEDVRIGLKKYIGTMLDYGVGSKDIHFVVSSGAAKAEVTTKITRVLKSLGYVVNQVTAEQEGQLALKSVLPTEYADKAFVVDIGSGNTKVSWISGGKISASRILRCKILSGWHRRLESIPGGERQGKTNTGRPPQYLLHHRRSTFRNG